MNENLPEESTFVAFANTLNNAIRAAKSKYPLTTEESRLLDTYRDIAKNGGNIYAQQKASSCCNTCLKRQKNNIIIGDVAGGIVGVVACFVFPPAWPISSSSFNSSRFSRTNCNLLQMLYWLIF
jgi:hypothetical protein